MNPKTGNRSWVKLWVNDWLEGTTRYQMSDAQRAFWIDLLAMAGRSRFGGVVCSGKDDEQWIGYPLAKFQGLLSEPIDVLATFELFQRTGKITLHTDGETLKLYTVFITNWARYQSEYERQKRSRSKRVTPENTPELQAKLHTETRKGYTTEEEVEGERDQTHCANKNRLHEGLFAREQPETRSETPRTNPQPEPAGESEQNAAILRVWRYYIEKLSKNEKLYSFTSLRRSKGRARLRECHAKTGGDLTKAEALMRLAVDALADSAFHRGENDRKKRYDSWEKNLFGSQEQLERWLEQT